jgi:predicted glycoside hydrolase/deacetylase ChbG (UPF0249 family)
MTGRLIVNADDFGYFDGVSAGILEGIAAGVVTATGVMANGPAFTRSAAALGRYPEVDVGVHLNVTLGLPLTPDFSSYLNGTAGAFSSKWKLAADLLIGRLPVALVMSEWRAQIEKCAAAGLQIRFLNSHEHVHMLPILYPVINRLAQEFSVRHVRFTHPEWSASYGIPALFRSSLVWGVGCMEEPARGTPKLLGLARSGRLDMTYLRKMLPRLRARETCELMCHPGHGDAAAAAYPGLRRYHDWEGELACLGGGEFRELLDRHSVRLVRFRELSG